MVSFLEFEFWCFFLNRRRFPATVNCWFCNENSKVAYDDLNKWTCPKCEQYNGFSEVSIIFKSFHLKLDATNFQEIFVIS